MTPTELLIYREMLEGRMQQLILQINNDEPSMSDLRAELEYAKLRYRYVCGELHAHETSMRSKWQKFKIWMGFS